jgi:archaellum component FlaC
LAERRSEKFAKKLMGRTEMEDALKRLDKLTQEEAWMSGAQNLTAMHIVDERVKGIVNTVDSIDNKVVEVDDRVVGVSDQVTGVSDQMAGVDGRVTSVNERVVTIDSRMKGIAGDVDEIRRLHLISPFLIMLSYSSF